MVKIAAIGGKLIKAGSKLGLYPSCCCCKTPTDVWRIYEEGFGVVYQTGSVLNKIFNGLPCCWSPPFYPYNGYMVLQVRCQYQIDPWITIDSWTTINGGPEKCFESSYPDPCCPGLLYTNCEPPTPTEPPTTEPPITIPPSLPPS